MNPIPASSARPSTSHQDSPSATDDDEGEQPVDLVGVVGEFGEFERAEDAYAKFEGVVDALEVRGVLGEGVVAEVGRPRAGGDYQAVGRGGSARR